MVGVMSGDDGDEQNRKVLQRSMVVVMAGDDGDEQRTEGLRHTEDTSTRFRPHSSSS